MKSLSNTQVFFAQKDEIDDGIPLDDDELVGVLSLKLADELDDVAVAVLAKVLGTQVRQLIFALDVVGVDVARRNTSA